MLYLRGISTKDFVPALAEFFGSEAGLSASTIQRLTRESSQELKEFGQRDLSQVDYVYLWADGVPFNIRLEEDRSAIDYLGQVACWQRGLLPFRWSSR